MNTEPIEQGEVEVRQVRGLFVPDVPAALQAGCSAACDEDRKVFVIVKAGITHAAAVQVNRVIEERAATVGSGLHSLQKIGKQRNMMLVDLGDFRYLDRIVAVMADRMMRVGHADVGIRTVALLSRELERDDARDIRL